MTIRDLYETLLTMIGCGATTEEENETILCNLECLIDDGSGNCDCAVAFHGGAYEGNTILENRTPLTVVTIEKDNVFTDICIYNPLTNYFDDIAVLIRF